MILLLSGVSAQLESYCRLQGKKDNAAEKEPEDTLNQNLKRLGQRPGGSESE